MMKNILPKLIIIFLALSIYSCRSTEVKKTPFIYQNKNRKVEIQILNGNDYMEYNKPTKTNIVLTNIEAKTFSIYGTGIRILEIKGGTIKTEIKVPQNHLATDTLNVKIRFGKKVKENHDFNIPMKKME